MKPLFKKIDCISLKVPNLDVGIEFYQNSLGHNLNWKSKTLAGLSFPQSKTELVLHTADRPMEVDLLVDSVPKAIKEFENAGGRLEVGPF